MHRTRAGTFFSLPLPTTSGGASAEASASAAESTSEVSHPHLENLGSGSYIRLTLPEGVAETGSALEKTRDAFEDVLISRGFLKGAGIESFGDELGRSVRQDAGSVARDIKERTAQHISSTDAPTSPTTFAPATHSFVNGASTVTSGAATYTGKAAEALAHVSISVGERVAGFFGIGGGGGPPALKSPDGETPPILLNADADVGVGEEGDWTANDEPEIPSAAIASDAERHSSAWERTKVAASSAASGIGQGVKDVSTTSTDSAHAAIHHSYGEEAAGLASQTGNALGDTAKAGGNVLAGTSAIVLGGQVAYGASKQGGNTEPGPKAEAEAKKEESGDIVKSTDSLDEIPL